MLYTRKGDSGLSGLFGTSARFPKSSAIYEALGTVDELNSLLGILRSLIPPNAYKIPIAPLIQAVQECLFIVQAELAGAHKSITPHQLSELETCIETIEARIENPHAFVIPGTTTISAWCDYARTVARRAERSVINTHAEHPTSTASRAYLNRLSSFLYALARYTAQSTKKREPLPSYKT